MKWLYVLWFTNIEKFKLESIALFVRRKSLNPGFIVSCQYEEKWDLHRQILSTTK